MRPVTGYHDTQHNDSIMGLLATLSITLSSAFMLSVLFFIVMLSDGMLNVIMPSVVAAIAEAGLEAQPPQI
jgi:hypothetical protein